MNLKISEIMELLPENQAIAMYYEGRKNKVDIDTDEIINRLRIKIQQPCRIYRLQWKQAACILIVILALVSLNIPAVRAAVQGLADKLLSVVIPITDEVRDYVGKKLGSEIYTIIDADGNTHTYNSDGEVIPNIEKTQEFPENEIIKENSFSGMTPTDISVFKITDSKLPQIMIPNNAMAVFTDERAVGWNLKAGDTVTISFEKYPHEIKNQTIMVGYIQDGKVYTDEIIKEIKGKYTMEIKSDGTYNFCFLGLSSDPIAIKSGTIEIES